jgi:hypothetical protein
MHSPRVTDHGQRIGLGIVMCRYQTLDQRLDSIEGTLITLLRSVKEKAARPAAAAAVGPGGEAAADGE